MHTNTVKKPALIRALLYEKTNNRIISGGKELLSTWQQDDNTSLRLDIEDEPSEAERQILQDSFDLHPMAIQDAQ